MPKYLLRASYTQEGAKGVMKEGGAARRAAVEKSLQPLGARLESFYFAMGDDDVYSVIEAPDNTTMLAISMAVNSTGLVNLKTTVLLSTEEVDAAVKTSVNYRAPGR